MRTKLLVSAFHQIDHCLLVTEASFKLPTSYHHRYWPPYPDLRRLSKGRLKPCNALILVLILLATPTFADVAGTAAVIDGDTLEADGRRIRLHGIDAPESRQLCRLEGKTPLVAGVSRELCMKIARHECENFCGEDITSDQFESALAKLKSDQPRLVGVWWVFDFSPGELHRQLAAVE